MSAEDTPTSPPSDPKVGLEADNEEVSPFVTSHVISLSHRTSLRMHHRLFKGTMLCELWVWLVMGVVLL